MLESHELSPIRMGEYGTEARAQAVIRAWQHLKPTKILAVSVLDESFNHALKWWVQSHLRVEIDYIRTQKSSHGVEIAYADPSKLGADRFVALVAAHRHVKTASIIVDCGTAITIDALSASGQHRGGVILPGLTTMRNSLTGGTARIKKLTRASSYPLFAKNTEDAVLSGTIRAVAATIDRIGADMTLELEEPVTRTLCGGDAQQLAPWLRDTYRIDPALLMKGLALFNL